MAFTPYNPESSTFSQPSSGGSGFVPFDAEKGFVDPAAPKPASNFVGSLVSPFVRIGQVAGASVARAFGAPEERIRASLEAPVEIDTGIFGKAKVAGVTPGVSEGRTLAGAALEAGSLFTPVGRIARGIGSVASFAGRLAPTAGIVGAGATGGYIYDVGRGIQEGEEGVEAFKPGAATALGAAIPGGFATIGAATRGLGATAPTVINSLIKPLNKQFTYGKNPGRAVAQEGITANSLEELQAGIADTRRAIGQRLQTVGSRVQGELTISKPEILAPFENAIKAAVENNDQNLLARLVQARDAIGNIFSLSKDGRIVPVGTRLLERLTFTQGVQLKRLIGDLTKWTGQQTDDETVNGALTRVYGEVKGALNDLAEKNSPQMAAEVRGLNERYADLTSAEIATKYRDVLSKRQNLLSLPGKFGVGAGLLTALTTGIGIVPIIAGLSVAALEKILGSTAVKTRLAKALAKLSPDELTQLSRQNPSVFERLKRDFKFPGDVLLETKVGQRVEKSVVESLKNAPGLSIKDVSGGVDSFKGFTDLSTKTLEKLKGRSTVSKEFIENLTNQPDLKQAERDTIRRILADEPDTVNVKAFADKVKTELLPLKRGGGSLRDTGDMAEMSYDGEGFRYESVVLPDAIRGPIANYSEHVYGSPIKTSAGEIHFGGFGDAENYFAHTRVEDLADSGVTKFESTGQSYNAMTGQVIPHTKRVPRPNEAGSTRRVIELQSDLFQKGRLEGERMAGRVPSNTPAENARLDELDKLEPYRNTWHERIIREEVKQAAKDGKTKLQFPTGETAMKIEGLGDSGYWLDTATEYRIEPNQLKVGMQVQQGRDGLGQGSDWIITDVLGDGKFKAVPKDTWERVQEMKTSSAPRQKNADAHLESSKESFDISGKVDTSNPIYRFYEKEVGKYLTNKYGAKRIKDPQGVEWLEVDVRKDQARLPVEAFGAAAIPALTGFDNDTFKDKIVFVENERAVATGSDPYTVIGETGDLGKYQVSPASLKDWSKAWLDKEYSQQEFLKDPKAQEDFFEQFLAVVDRFQLTDEQAAIAWHMGWGELGTGPRETRDKRFLRKLGSNMQTEIGKEYLRRFNRVSK